MVLAIAVQRHWVITQADVSTGFLNGTVGRDPCVRLPKEQRQVLKQFGLDPSSMSEKPRYQFMGYMQRPERSTNVLLAGFYRWD